jgi:hypothetical protein
MENNDVKKEDDSTSFMPSKPLNDSGVNDSGVNDSVAEPNNEAGNDTKSSSPSQENIPETTSMPSSAESSMAASTMPSPSMQYPEQSDTMPNVSLPGSSELQTMLTSTGDLVSGECYRYLGNVKNIDGQLAPIFSSDCGGRSGGRSRKRRRRRKGGATEKSMVEGGRRSKRVNKYRKRRSYRGGEFPSYTSPLMAYNMPV